MYCTHVNITQRSSSRKYDDEQFEEIKFTILQNFVVLLV